MTLLPRNITYPVGAPNMSKMTIKHRILKRVREGEEEATASVKKARCAPAPAQTPQQLLESAQRDLLRAQERQCRASLQTPQAPPRTTPPRTMPPQVPPPQTMPPRTMPPPQAPPQVPQSQLEQQRQLEQLQSIIASRQMPQRQLHQQQRQLPQLQPILASPPPFALPDLQQSELHSSLQRVERAMRALQSAQSAQSAQSELLLDAQSAREALQNALQRARVEAIRVAKHETFASQMSVRDLEEELRRRAQPLREQLQRAQAQGRALLERMRRPPPAPAPLRQMAPPLRLMAPPPPPAPAPPPQVVLVAFPRQTPRCPEGHR